MCSARGGQVHGLSAPLAWWQLLALCWMIKKWPPVQWLLPGVVWAILRTATETHHGLMKKYSETSKPILAPYTNFDLGRSAQRCTQVRESFQRGTMESHWWWGRRPVIPMHLAIDRGAVPLAPGLQHCWWEREVLAPSAFSGLLFISVASFPNKDNPNLQEVQPVTKESWFPLLTSCFIYRISEKKL